MDGTTTDYERVGGADAVRAVVQRFSEDVLGDDQLAPYLEEVVHHQRRTPGVAVITVRPMHPVPYRPGQSVSVLAPAAGPCSARSPTCGPSRRRPRPGSVRRWTP